MIKIPTTIVWPVVTAIGSVFLVGVGVLMYSQYGSMLVEKNIVAEIRTPENFVGGLTDVHQGVGVIKPTEVIELKDGDEFNLEATIITQEVGNKLIKRLAYNGQIPGPVLKVEKGSKVTVHFTNNIDMETALHSHGLRGNWKFDGAVPITQDPIPVGGTFTYELEFPDTGVFWYHPHIREDYQQELGLYGNMIVTEQNYWNDVDKEEYIIFDDVLENGDFDPTIVTNALMGRYGDRLLINDKEDFKVTVKQGDIFRFFLTNVANTRTFDVTFEGALVKQVGGDNGRSEKEVVIQNSVIAPSERYVLELLYQEPGIYPILNRGVQIGEVVVEKNDVSKLSQFNELRSNASDYGTIRANMSELLKQKPDKSLRLDMAVKNMSAMSSSTLGQVDSEGNVFVMGVKMTKEKGIEHCRLMSQMPECGPLLATTDTVLVTLADKEMTVAQARQYCQLLPTTEGCDKYQVAGMPAMQMHTHIDGIEWEDGMLETNQTSSNQTIEWILEDQDTGKKNDAIDWSFKKGDMVKVRIFNDGKGMHPMQHPIHFHGQRFVVLGRDGVANDNLQWKDTVLIPMGQTVDLLVDMSNPGIWMAHCHIAEHLGSGMMFNFRVD